MTDGSSNKKTAFLKIAKAEQAFHDAKLMIQFESWFSAVNRLYYSCFYMISALLVTDDIFPKTHSGVKTQFNQLYIKTGKIPIEQAEFFAFLFNKRQDSDYNDFDIFTREEVVSLAEKTDFFLKTVHQIIIKVTRNDCRFESL
jgi:uncharacterized protein (UPF0332 family)